MDSFVPVAVFFSLLSLTSATPPSQQEDGVCSQVNLMHQYCTNQMNPGWGGVNRLRITHPRIGKAGPRGQPGLPGIVNYSLVDEKIDRRFSVIQTLRHRIQILETRMRENERSHEMNSDANREIIQTLRRQVEMLEGKLQELTSTVNREVTVECEDGFVYREKCYFANIYPTSRIQFQHKESNCSAKGGKVGSILNLEHQILAENYVRPRIPSSSSTYTLLWLATIYSHSTETFITPEGHSLPSTSIRWVNSNYPKPDSTKTTMVLQLKKDIMNENNGVYNSGGSPDRTTPGVFCEK